MGTSQRLTPVALAVEMGDNRYQVLCSILTGLSSWSSVVNVAVADGTRTTTGFTALNWYGGGTVLVGFNWEVRGYAAA